MRGTDGDGLCSKCPVGLTNTADFRACTPICTGDLEYWDGQVCQQTPLGNVPSATKSDYTPCSNNTYRNTFYQGTTVPMKTCQPCPNGSLNNTVGSSNIHDCICNNNKVINTNDCQFCPMGMQRHTFY